MSLNIGDALSTGAEKLTTTAGLQLAVVYSLVALVTNAGVSSMPGATGPRPGMGPSRALELPIGTAGGVVVAILGSLLGAVLMVVIYRTVAHDASALDSIPAGVTDDLLVRVLSLIAATIVIGLLMLLIFLPGIVLTAVAGPFGVLLVLVSVVVAIYVGVALTLTQVFVTVENEGPIEAITSSWELTSGSRLSLFGLGVVVAVIGLVVSVLGLIGGIINPVAGALASAVVSGFVNVFSSGVLVDAYHQLSSAQESQEDLLQQPE